MDHGQFQSDLAQLNRQGRKVNDELQLVTSAAKKEAKEYPLTEEQREAEEERHKYEATLEQDLPILQDEAEELSANEAAGEHPGSVPP